MTDPKKVPPPAARPVDQPRVRMAWITDTKKKRRNFPNQGIDARTKEEWKYLTGHPHEMG